MRSLKKYIRAFARVIWTNLRLLSGKVAHGSSLRFSPITCLSFSDKIDLAARTKADFGKYLRTRGRCTFNVQEKGELLFGESVFLNEGCQFNCHYKIHIGDGCEFGPNVLIYDHDHIFKGGSLHDGSFAYGEVSIGSNCWIGAGTIILRGTIIGNNSVIAAGSVVKGDIPENSLLIQKRHSCILKAK